MIESGDVLQIRLPGNDWQPFSAIHTASEAARAESLVRGGQWDGKPAEFRAVRLSPFSVKLP